MSNTTEQKPQSIDPLNVKPEETHLLYRYVTDTGRILPRRITGLSAKQQRAVTKTIKRARNLLLMK
jgi:small subunit ribosomal protein S18